MGCSRALVIEKSALPLLTLLLCILTPLPIAIGIDPDATYTEDGPDLLYFITGALGTSSIGLPLVLAHHQSISITSSYLMVSGAWAVMVVLAILIATLRRRQTTIS
jgi:hypothetical protein